MSLRAPISGPRAAAIRAPLRLLRARRPNLRGGPHVAPSTDPFKPVFVSKRRLSPPATVAIGAVHQFQPVVDQVVTADEIRPPPPPPPPHADRPACRGSRQSQGFCWISSMISKVSRLSRSILFAKGQDGQVRAGGRLRTALRVWDSTPLAPSITMIAASTAVRVR